MFLSIAGMENTRPKLARDDYCLEGKDHIEEDAFNCLNHC